MVFSILLLLFFFSVLNRNVYYDFHQIIIKFNAVRWQGHENNILLFFRHAGAQVLSSQVLNGAQKYVWYGSRRFGGPSLFRR